MGLKKHLWPAFFLSLGLISLIGQTVILREITTLFYGNELFYGLGLGFWLLFTGWGSLWFYKSKYLTGEKRLGLVLLTMVFLLPTLIISLRLIMAELVPFGSLPDLKLSLLILILSLLLFCLPLGALFPAAVLAWKGKKTANLAFFWETLGFACGGLVFSLILASTSFPLTDQLNSVSQKWRYPNLVNSLNSKYSQINLTKTNQQTNFFINGQVSFTSEEGFESEKLLNLIFPFTKSADKALIFGNPNLAKTMSSRFPVKETGFLEPDEKLYQLEKELLGTEVKPILKDPPRYFSETEKKWDLVIFSPGNPQTLLTNRHFTQENFNKIKQRLNRNGILAIVLYLPTDYQSQEALLFSASIYQAFQNVFPENQILAQEDQLIIMGSNNKLQIYQDRINPAWADYFWQEIGNKQGQEIAHKIKLSPAKANTDSEPTAFFYHQLFWQTMFSFNLPQVLEKATKFGLLFLAGLVLITFPKTNFKLRLGLTAASSSLIFMALEVLVIFFYQTKIGYLYHQISLIFATALLGMAGGVKLSQAVKNRKQALTFSFLAYLIPMAVFILGYKTRLASATGFWLILVLAVGACAGLVFALVNRIYLNQAKNPGYIYAFDLFGGFFGAVLTTAFLLPLYGLKKLMIGLSLLILVNALIIERLLPNSRNN